MNKAIQRKSLYSDGVLYWYKNFPSTHVKSRHVEVWCPPGYDNNLTARYPVIYMHDGQNLFEPAHSYIGVDWGIDESVARLMEKNVTEGVIVVGIWKTRQRRRDYMPQKPLQDSSGQTPYQRFVKMHHGMPQSDAYLKFMVEELKPFIDATYRTLPERVHTSVMGSSMGGLISLYALCEYPEIFGGAGCLSTHWPAGKEILVDYMGNALPQSGSHKIYFDYGTETLDAEYEPYQQQMDLFMQAAGYRHGKNWLTQKFEGAEHSERAWRERVDIPLRFLLEKR